MLVRGNHETCGRAGEGWFRLLDPYPFSGSCTLYTDPYAVPLAGLQLLMLDSSNVNDYQVEPDQVQEYRRQLSALFDAVEGDAWLLTHDPPWVFGHAGVENGVETLFRDNPNLHRR